MGELLDGEPLLPLSDLARRGPGHRGAARLHAATLSRWILKGARGTSGQRIRLEAVRTPGRWLTSEAALWRFLNALAAAPVTEPARSPSARQRASAAAARQLDQLGA
jgi:hypothetical protein